MIAEIITRLSGSCGLKVVGGGLDLAQIATAPASPAAYVLSTSESAQSSPRMVGATTQRVSEQIGVVLIQRSAASAAAVAGDVEALRDAVRDRLKGWAPAGCTPFEYVGARLVDIAPGEIRRLLTFSTSYLI